MSQHHAIMEKIRAAHQREGIQRLRRSLQAVIALDHPTIKEIRQAVARVCHVDEAEMLERSRNWRIVVPRQIAMVFAVRFTDKSKLQIARATKQPNDSAVRFACQKFNPLIDKLLNEFGRARSRRQSDSADELRAAPRHVATTAHSARVQRAATTQPHRPQQQ